jgi:hypothetical protein
MPSSEDSSSSRVVLWMHVHPPDQTKQCNGTCGLSKPQSDYADRQWRKKEKGGRICLDCSRSARPPPPPPPAEPTKKCDGPCGRLKPAAEYTMGQWRKPGGEGERRKKGGCICLDCCGRGSGHYGGGGVSELENTIWCWCWFWRWIWCFGDLELNWPTYS